jgi:TadE-like protein
MTMLPVSKSGRVGSDAQALTEFALVVGLFVFVVGALIQFSLILWSINTATQVARDTARWAATQSTIPCDSTPSRDQVATKADSIARSLSLSGYRAGTWTTASTIDTTPQEGVGADWPIPVGGTVLFPTDCPPEDNQTPWFVRVRINHPIPIFLPGLQWVLPACGSGYCLSSTAEIRMEPKAP